MQKLSCVIVLFTLTACGNKEKADGAGGGSDCKPLSVTVGGEEIAGLGHGLGYLQDGNYTLHVFNHDKATCEQLLAPSRQVPAGEESIAFGAGGSFGPSIGYDANGKVGDGVDAKLTKKPAKQGDAMAMCVKATLPVKIGKNKGKDLVAEGLVQGTFCGDRK